MPGSQRWPERLELFLALATDLSGRHRSRLGRTGGRRLPGWRPRSRREARGISASSLLCPTVLPSVWWRCP